MVKCSYCGNESWSQWFDYHIRCNNCASKLERIHKEE